MKIFIHAGMHKTGTTSIQHTFHALPQQLYTWAPIATRAEVGQAGQLGHNLPFILGFLDEAELVGAYPFYRRDLRLPQLLQWRQAGRARLDAALRANDRPLFFFSQEAMQGLHASAVPRFAEYCRQFTDDIQVLIYVRPPVSFAQSMFQEALKGVLETGGEQFEHWPLYHTRFAPVEHSFGRARVRYKLYDRSRLKGGNVVLDLAAELGLPLTAAQVVTRNESLSLEAAALLYTFKSLLPPRRPTAFRPGQNDAFNRALARIGTTKLRFAPAVARGMVEQHRADLAWMEHRLGEPLADLPEDAAQHSDTSPIDSPAPAAQHPGTSPIDSAAPWLSSPLELHDIALQQVDAVEVLAGLSAPAGSSPRQRLLFALSALYDQQPRELEDAGA